MRLFRFEEQRKLIVLAMAILVFASLAAAKSADAVCYADCLLGAFLIEKAVVSRSTFSCLIRRCKAPIHFWMASNSAGVPGSMPQLA